MLTVTSKKLQASVLGRKFTRRRSIEEKKKNSTCSACGQMGHWAGDSICSVSSQKREGGGKGARGSGTSSSLNFNSGHKGVKKAYVVGIQEDQQQHDEQDHLAPEKASTYFSRERLRRVLRKKAAVILDLHFFTSADLDLHFFTSADLDLHSFTSADLDLHSFTSADLDLHSFTSADLDLHSLSADLDLHSLSADLDLHTLTPADLDLHTFTPADLDLHTLTSADLDLHTLTSADLDLHTLTPADLDLHTLTPADLDLHPLTSADLDLQSLTSADPSHLQI